MEDELLGIEIEEGFLSPLGDAPIIGDNVEFGIGAKIFGQVTINNNSILKSNSLTI